MNPDYEIEEYWLGLKQSMINFYRNKNYTRPIDAWSENLNDLQKNKQYNLIEENIRNYISLYAIDLIKSMNKYYSHILKTNIKRWNNISTKYNFNDPNTTHNNIFVLFSIFYMFVNKDQLDDNICNVFLEIELTVLYKNYTSLIKYAINFNKPSILKKLDTIVDVKKELINHFNMDEKLKKYSYEKLCKEIFRL